MLMCLFPEQGQGTTLDHSLTLIYGTIESFENRCPVSITITFIRACFIPSFSNILPNCGPYCLAYLPFSRAERASCNGNLIVLFPA